MQTPEMMYVLLAFWAFIVTAATALQHTHTHTRTHREDMLLKSLMLGPLGKSIQTSKASIVRQT